MEKSGKKKKSKSCFHLANKPLRSILKFASFPNFFLLGVFFGLVLGYLQAESNMKAFILSKSKTSVQSPKDIGGNKETEVLLDSLLNS